MLLCGILLELNSVSNASFQASWETCLIKTASFQNFDGLNCNIADCDFIAAPVAQNDKHHADGKLYGRVVTQL